MPANDEEYQQHHNLEKRQALLDLIPIGEFVNANHGVKGMVWAYNNSLLLIEDFGYDGTGFTVSLIASTGGKTRAELLQNAYLLPYVSERYPDPIDNTMFDGVFGDKPEQPDWLILSMPAGLEVRNIKWMSVWCQTFKTSFGEVAFPEFA